MHLCKRGHFQHLFLVGRCTFPLVFNPEECKQLMANRIQMDSRVYCNLIIFFQNRSMSLEWRKNGGCAPFLNTLQSIRCILVFTLFCTFSIDGYFHDMQMCITTSISLWIAVVVLIVFYVLIVWAGYILYAYTNNLANVQEFLANDPQFLYSLKASCLRQM